MAKEVKPFLYRRPHLFDGQCELFTWLEEADQDCFQYVMDLRIKLVDINPETIVGVLGKRLRDSQVTREDLRPGDDPRGNPYYEACFEELKKLQKAFTMLPAVRNLTIVEHTHLDPTPPAQMNDMFSKMLSHCFPDLRELSCTKTIFPINCMGNKPRLRRLSFTANSSSKDEQIAATVKELPSLHLELRRIEKIDPAQFDWGCTSEVLANIPPLQSLSLLEDVRSQDPSLVEEVFIESFDAMRRHLRSTQSLVIIANPPSQSPKAGIVKKNLFRFLEASRLRHVEVKGTYSSIYRHLPASIQKFVLRLDRQCCESVESEELFSDVVEDFMSHVKFRAIDTQNDPNIPGLINLTEIEIWIHGHPQLLEPDDDDENPRLLAEKIKMQLRKIGIHFKLVITPPNRHFSESISAGN
ncbi:uncharacterized protein KY384_005568 [Bacidia gigantensis]|uniref:uncharacterized protein n=1 Tax=Bacidia gigantensis TaxID=2732470 RepID=UPI001D04F10E|nr:uncharacterized protein KY384_005568 [Bacidia gigantensis]KAG8530086.1 hypothetical protein KY384_005568 [Bacidia gigantensis]